MSAKLQLTKVNTGYKLLIDGLDISHIVTRLYLEVTPHKPALAIIEIPCDIDIPDEIKAGLSIYMKDKDYQNDSQAKSI